MPTFLIDNQEAMKPEIQTMPVASDLLDKPALQVVEELSDLAKDFPKAHNTDVMSNQVKDEDNTAEESLSVPTDVTNYDVIAAAVASAHSTTFSAETTESTAAVANEILPQISMQHDAVVEQDTEKKTEMKDSTSILPVTPNPSIETSIVQTLAIKSESVVAVSCLPTPMKLNDTRKLLQCPKCPSTFYSRSGYYRHTKKCGIPLEKAAHLRKMTKLAKNAFKRAAPKFSRPVLHPSVIQEDKVSHRITYKCPKCPSDFFSKSGFYKHIKRCKAGKLN